MLKPLDSIPDDTPTLNTPPITPARNKSLFSFPRVYADFLARLHAANMLSWKGGAKSNDGVLGVFFVRNKDGSLRRIFDTRLLNQDFLDPPKTRLPTATSFPMLNCQDDLSLGSGALRSAFYVLQLPAFPGCPIHSPRYQIKVCQAPHFDIPVCIDNDYVLPCLQVLPMGWSWSLHLCPSFVSRTVEEAVGQTKRFLTDHLAASFLVLLLFLVPPM